MKKLIVCSLLSFLFFTSYAQYSTERSGYDGDFFSLQGALDLFKESSNLRAFERKLNSEKYWANNLDLNYDGEIDYVRVEHRQQGNFHAIILQALVDRYEVQDVAVIEIEVLRRGEAILQIIGDEDLYGEEVVVEPVADYADYRRGYHSEYGDFVNVYYWRPVQNILDRQYQVYASPYRWQYYPTWWGPRLHITWNIFRPRIVIYSTRFHIVRRHRLVRVRDFYRPYRSYCPSVLQRSNTVRVRQGRAPIYRTQSSQPRNRNASSARSRNGVAQNSRTRSTPSRQSASSVSRKRAESSARPGRSNQNRSAASSNERSRSFETPSRKSRSSEVSRKRTESTARPGRSNQDRSAASSNQRSRNIETPSRKSRSSETRQRSTEVQRPSRSSSPERSRSSAGSQSRNSSGSWSNRSQSTTRSSAPKARQESRSKASRSQSSSRSRATTPSASKTRKPSSSSSRTRSSSSSTKARKSSGSSSSRTRSSSSSSKSRKGRGQ